MSRRIQRKMFPGSITVGDGSCDEFLGAFYRLRQSEAACQKRGNGRRVCAAGAVRGDSFDERSAQQQFYSAIKKKVHGLAGAAQMAAFDKGRATKTRVDFAGSRTQVFN